MPLPINRARNPTRFNQITQMLEQTTGKTREQRLTEMFPIRAYRGVGEGKEMVSPHATFFTDDRGVSRGYTESYASENGSGIYTGHSLPAQLSLGKRTAVIGSDSGIPGGDTEYAFNRVPLNMLPDDIATAIGGTHRSAVAVTNTDAVVKAAKELGYDSVVFKNMVDPGGDGRDPESFNPSTVYAILDPSLIRSTSAIANPRRRHHSDILASLGIATAGLGAASKLRDDDN